MSKCYASTLITLAKSEIGYKEKNTNSYLDSKTENAGDNNWNKYAHFIDSNYPDFYNGKKNGYAWCDIFVDYLFIKSFGLTNALRLTGQPLKSTGAGCTYSLKFYKAINRLENAPTIGSQIFFGTNQNSVAHTGVVYKYDSMYVYTIEGNTSNQVAYRKYRLDDKTIVGYGCPNYDKEGAMKTNEEIAREVLAGKWGNGVERRNKITEAGYDYSAIQSIVNKLASGEPVEAPKVDTPVEHPKVETPKETLEITVDLKKYDKLVLNIQV